MPELPASVRLALWVTAAWRSGGTIDDAVTSALPDVDAVGGGIRTLDLWRDLGERTVLVALPTSGDLAGMPRAAPDAVAAATDAEECLVAPGLGALLVPEWSTFGAPSVIESEGTTGPDAGTRVDWTAYDCEPVPTHRVEALDPRETTRLLTDVVLETTHRLDELGGRPFHAAAAREAVPRPSAWALPDDIPGQTLRAITFAATIGTAAAAGIDGPHDGPDAFTSTQRLDLLRALARAADRALADATNAAVSAIAHPRTSR
ncbi:hypothetical protein BCF74_1476 [Knoellia remsis]|uniref:Uncharacterized protein n=1 Tax=Knoellia remsis TaxID=407159 RepID=A0A2T0TT77_9MICO|nr:hypothetical protein [Knoellia remsis]PRY48912.1 hypothetical protein BCF74_1476 [Knoellia remsis]